MNHDLQAARDALNRDAATAINAFVATIQSIKISAEPLNTRADALTQEEQRRSRAGVRVNMAAPDGLQQRATALLGDMGQHFAAQSNEQAGHAAALAMVIAKALVLVDQMAAELDGPEHAAAVRAEAEAVAEIEAAGKKAAVWKACEIESQKVLAHVAAERAAGR